EGAKVSGAEMELAALLSEDDKLGLTLSYTKTKLGQLVAATNDYALPACFDATLGGNCLNVTGHELPHAPKFSMQLQYEHQIRMGNGGTLTPRINAHYQTSNWLSVFNLGPGDQQKSYSLIDLGARYASAKNWYADFYVRNVSDAKIKSSAGSSGAYATAIWTAQYLPPRTFGVNAGYNF
ncbi:MAG TPA: TonB-dependent receptor, partial [Burkholderiaceae bacterium]